MTKVKEKIIGLLQVLVSGMFVAGIVYGHIHGREIKKEKVSQAAFEQAIRDFLVQPVSY